MANAAPRKTNARRTSRAKSNAAFGSFMDKVVEPLPKEQLNADLMPPPAKIQQKSRELSNARLVERAKGALFARGGEMGWDIIRRLIHDPYANFKDDANELAPVIRAGFESMFTSMNTFVVISENHYHPERARGNRDERAKATAPYRDSGEAWADQFWALFSSVARDGSMADRDASYAASALLNGFFSRFSDHVARQAAEWLINRNRT